MDWYTINNFDLKGTFWVFFDGYIGLLVHPNGSVKPVSPLYTFQSQHRLYKLKHSREQDCSITTIFHHFLSLKDGVDPEYLDFVPKYICNPEGGLYKTTRLSYVDISDADRAPYPPN